MMIDTPQAHLLETTPGKMKQSQKEDAVPAALEPRSAVELTSSFCDRIN